MNKSENFPFEPNVSNGGGGGGGTFTLRDSLRSIFDFFDVVDES